jgi:hypothetical protein
MCAFAFGRIRFSAIEFVFLFREQSKQHLSSGFVGFPFQKTAKVLDVEAGDSAVHGLLHPFST